MRAGLDNGKAAARLKLDVLFPVNGYKRYLSSGAYEFLYPQTWLEDVTLYRRRVERAEFQRGVEFKQLEDLERVAKGQTVVQPAVGFGPPAGSGEENLSIVAAPSPGLVCELPAAIRIPCVRFWYHNGPLAGTYGNRMSSAPPSNCSELWPAHFSSTTYVVCHRGDHQPGKFVTTAIQCRDPHTGLSECVSAHFVRGIV